MVSSDRRLVRAMHMILFAGIALSALILLSSPTSDAESQADESVNQQSTITVDTNFPGLLVGYDSNPLVPAPVTFQADVGSVHMIITKSPQPDSPIDTRYRFLRWQGGPMTWGWNITVGPNATYTANFVTQYLIQIRSNMPGPELNVDVGDCGVALPAPGPLYCWEDEGSNPTLLINTPQSPVPGCRYVFLQWSDGNTQPTRMIGPITGPATYIAMWSAECYLTVTVDASCGASTVSLSGWYTLGDVVNIYWQPPTGLPPDERYRFKKWVGTGNGNYTGPSPAASFTMNGAITETAYCYHEFLITIETSPVPLDYIVDEMSANGLRFCWWEYMSIHWFNVTQTTQGTGNTRYLFIQWSDGSTNPNHPPFVVLGSASFVANFQTQHKITLSQIPPTPAGLGDLRCVERTDCWYDEGSPATIIVDSPWPAGATVMRYDFASWSGDASGTVSPYAFNAVNAPKSATANWVIWYKVTVTSPYGNPTCSNADCWFSAGQSALISLTNPFPGPTGTRYVFDYWTNADTGATIGTANPLTITMDSWKNVTAIWKTQHMLTIDSPCGVSTDCGSPAGAGWYDKGLLATVSVTTPYTDIYGDIWDFVGWGGDASGTSSSMQVLMDSSKNVTASWSMRFLYRLTVVTPYGTATCHPYADCAFPPGSIASVTLSTLEVSGGTGTRFVFSVWTGDATNSSHPLILEMDSSKTVTAVWNTQHLLTINSICGSEDDCGSPTGAGWYNEGSSVAISVSMTHVDHSGKIWDFHNWTGGVHSDTHSTTIVMNGPETAMVTWTERPPSTASGVDMTVWLLAGIVSIAVALALVLLMAKRKKANEEEHGKKT